MRRVQNLRSNKVLQSHKNELLYQRHKPPLPKVLAKIIKGYEVKLYFTCSALYPKRLRYSIGQCEHLRVQGPTASTWQWSNNVLITVMCRRYNLSEVLKGKIIGLQTKVGSSYLVCHAANWLGYESILADRTHPYMCSDVKVLGYTKESFRFKLRHRQIATVGSLSAQNGVPM